LVHRTVGVQDLMLIVSPADLTKLYSEPRFAKLSKFVEKYEPT